jgi:hypothetical protein
MKLIFLDVDGVLNGCDTREKVLGDDNCFYDGIDTPKMDLLKEIIDKTDAYIIVSSSWRLYDNFMSHLENKLGDYVTRIKGITPTRLTFSYPYRYQEIQEWFQQNKHPDKFIILDDMVEKMVETFGDSYFQTNEDIGLTKQIANKCIEFLNKE